MYIKLQYVPYFFQGEDAADLESVSCPQHSHQVLTGHFHKVRTVYPGRVCLHGQAAFVWPRDALPRTYSPSACKKQTERQSTRCEKDELWRSSRGNITCHSAAFWDDEVEQIFKNGLYWEDLKWRGVHAVGFKSGNSVPLPSSHMSMAFQEHNDLQDQQIIMYKLKWHQSYFDTNKRVLTNQMLKPRIVSSCTRRKMSNEDFFVHLLTESRRMRRIARVFCTQRR